MSKILAIHASPRGDRSHSRRLAESFLSAWQARHPQALVTRREVGRALIPAVNEAFVAAAFTRSPKPVRCRCRPIWRSAINWSASCSRMTCC